jgi:DNA polymerase
MAIRCALCPAVNKCLPPSGNEQAEILGIGEAPGIEENKKGTIFVGKTGQELTQQYLPLAGLQRGNILLVNAISCLPTSAKGKLDPNSKKDQALLACCANTNLYPLIERGRWRALLPMGRFACDALLPDFDLEMGHGIPLPTLFGVSAYPQYHPALGIHEPKKMSYIRRDWYRLKLWLRGQLPLIEDPYPEPDYREVEHLYELDELEPEQDLAADTESSRYQGPFCLTYSQAPGTGRLIRASRVDLLAAFQRKLDVWRARLIFHNWLYDEKITREMALQFPHRHLVDTMARIFHLGNLPQGLKALAWRELGMTMQDFEDVVKPYSTAKVLAYYRMAQTYEWPKPEPQLVMDPTTKLWKVKKPHGMSTKLKTFFTYLKKNAEKDVFAAWWNWEAEHSMMEEQLGKWPGMDISHVPFDKALYYACRDPDATLRLWHYIKLVERQVRKSTQERWMDAA